MTRGRGVSCGGKSGSGSWNQRGGRLLPPTEAATTATATTASRCQSGIDRVPYATDSMPSCDICLCASVGRGVQSTFITINAAYFDVAVSFRSGRFSPSPCLLQSPYAYPLPSYTGMYGAIPYFRSSEYLLTHPFSSRGAGLAFKGPTATHRVSAFRNVQPELPLQRGPARAGRSQTSIRVNYTD